MKNKTDQPTMPDIFGNQIPIMNTVPTTPKPSKPGPVFLELALTETEATTLQHALAYYSQAMHDTGDEVNETIGTAQAKPWYKKAGDSAAVLMQLNRIIAHRHGKADQMQPTTATPQPQTQTGLDSYAAARIFDTAGKIIAVIVAASLVLGTIAQLATPR